MLADARGALWSAWHSLVRRGKDPIKVGVTGIAALGCRFVRSGRKIGNRNRGRGCIDVLDPRAQRRCGFKIQPLPPDTHYGAGQGQRHLGAVEERLQGNTTTPVVDQVVFRLDFKDWLKTLSARERRIVEAMAQDERTQDLSERFALSPGRISQMRREFQQGWSQFCGDLPIENRRRVRVA
jgi:hypothetical protein